MEFEKDKAIALLCKSHYTKKWDNRFRVPLEPTSDWRKNNYIWNNYYHKMVEVSFEKLDNGIPVGVVFEKAVD